MLCEYTADGALSELSGRVPLNRCRRDDVIKRAPVSPQMNKMMLKT